MYIVIRILRKVANGEFIIDGTLHETIELAKHHFHTVMSTYAYGNNAGYDYVACYIINLDGTRYEWEVDNRIPYTTEE